MLSWQSGSIIGGLSSTTAHWRSCATRMSCGLSRSSSSTIGESGDLLGAIEIEKQRVESPLRQKVGSYDSALIEAKVELHIHCDWVDALASAFATICRDLDRFTRSDAPCRIALGRGDKSFASVWYPGAFPPCCPHAGLACGRSFPPRGPAVPFTEADDALIGWI